jgi:hypothetical protein
MRPSALRVDIDGRAHALAQDHALRVRADAGTNVKLQDGQVIIGSIRDKI